MKKIALMLLGGIALLACHDKKDQYVVNGNIGGDVNGAKVLLVNIDTYPPVTIDSTIIKNGKFQLKGKVPSEGMYQLIIDRTPAGQESNPGKFLSDRFYLENSVITLNGHADSLPTYYWSKDNWRKPARVIGSASHDLYLKYKAALKDLYKKSNALEEEYLHDYHVPALEGTFNTATGVRISRALDSLRQEENRITWDFIKRHPSSIVSYDLARQYLGGLYVDLTVPQIDELTQIISQGWKDRPEKLEAFKQAAEKAKKIAVGTKYQDIKLITPTGETVKLSEYIPEGKYTLLEFWASWCGPCRGEIPHLRKIYQDYKDKGFEIVSVSIDQKKEDWEKAMKEEGMVWTQLCDPKGFEGPVAIDYNVTGVPTCILLDPQGRILKTDMRGARLDAILQEIYGTPSAEANPSQP